MDWNANAMATPTPGREKDVVSYQIDCQTTKKGKMIAGTKRRICWKFGFSNRDAIQRGKTGMDCRGEEHEVVFVWSLTSGKKFVLADGHEVHWSKQSPFSEKFDGAWQCSWQSQMAGAKREMVVVAHSSTALFDKKKTHKKSCVADSSFRNFELLIDGVSFSDMPQMFELGLTKTVEDQRRIRMGGTETASQQQQQQQQQRRPQRRKHLYDNNELDASSTHSYSSQHQQLPRPQRRKQMYSNDLDVGSRHSISEHSISHNSFSADLLYNFQEQPYHHQQQQAPLASCNELLSQSMPDMQLMSQSMPDMQYGFSTSPTSVMSGSVPHLNFTFSQHSYPLQHQNQISPTSVTQHPAASNPFDVYTTGAFKPQQHQQPQQQQHQQVDAQFNNNNYAPYPQQRSTVY